MGDETQAQLAAVLGDKCPTLNKWADTLIAPAAAENVAAVATNNYGDVRKAADRFAMAGAVQVEVWTYADFKERIASLPAR